MSGYTLEDIDIIRRKSGISYQEAVALLEYHNGNLLQALIDLEKNGKILKEQPKEKKTRKSGFFSVLRSLYCIRVRIRREESVVINFSIIFCVICLIFAPYFTIISSIAALALGYRFSFTMHDGEFEEADLENTFQHAAENVKSSLGDMARSFTGSFDGDKAKDRGEKHSSYYDAAGKAGRRAPQMQTPKRVDSQDGAVRFEEDGDGYSSATIE